MIEKYKTLNIASAMHWMSLFFILGILPCGSFARVGITDSLRKRFLSQPHDLPVTDYIPAVPRLKQTSPAFTYSGAGFSVVQVNVNSSGQNIVGDAANEPSLAVDPNNPKRMAIGWRQFDDVTDDFRQAGIGYTSDGGRSWIFPGAMEPGVFRSDPVLEADKDGNFYYLSLTVDADFWCDMFKSSDGGVTWDLGTYAYGGDKQWMAIDTSEGLGKNNIYIHWTQEYGVCPPGSFTRSTDQGNTYSGCDMVPVEPNWGTLAAGPDGELYVCGMDTTGYAFVVAKSTNAKDSSAIVIWDTAVVVNLDGFMSGWADLNPQGLLGQAWIAVDHTTGVNRGNVYLLSSVARYAFSDPCDVMFARSTDGGITWSTPVRINDDDTLNGAWQWFGTMSVAPNGRIDVVWLDTRNDPGGYLSELFYSYSLDGGLTWSPNKQLSQSFDPHIGWPVQQKMGDYFDMASFDHGAHLAWAATFNGEQDVYYSFIAAPCQPGTVIDTAVTLSNDTLHAGIGYDWYRWLNCGNNTIVSGAVSNTFIPSVNGYYAVELTLNGCMDTSGCQYVEVVGLRENELGTNNNIEVIVNKKFLEIYSSSIEKKPLNIHLIDLLGKKLLDEHIQMESGERKIIPLHGIQGGIYIAAVISDDNIIRRKIFIPHH